MHSCFSISAGGQLLLTCEHCNFFAITAHNIGIARDHVVLCIIFSPDPHLL